MYCGRWHIPVALARECCSRAEICHRMKLEFAAPIRMETDFKKAKTEETENTSFSFLSEQQLNLQNLH